MKTRFKLGIVGLGYFVIFLGTASAGRIDQRQLNQAQRTIQGVQSGTIAENEQRVINAQQNRIQNAEEKAKSDGVVTPKEHVKIERMQNKASKTIHRFKHNSKVR